MRATVPLEVNVPSRPATSLRVGSRFLEPRHGRALPSLSARSSGRPTREASTPDGPHEKLGAVSNEDSWRRCRGTRADDRSAEASGRRGGPSRNAGKGRVQKTRRARNRSGLVPPAALPGTGAVRPQAFHVRRSCSKRHVHEDRAQRPSGEPTVRGTTVATALQPLANLPGGDRPTIPSMSVTLSVLPVPAPSRTS